MKYKNTTVYIIALVWFVNGFFCKLLGFVPRHQEIVESVIGLDKPSAYFLTKIIGISEVIMAIWIVSRIRSKFNAILQILIIMTMNILEFVFATNLLLWGKLNFSFAVLFCLFIYYSEFHLNQKN